jgi:hypothetical protein
MTQLPGGFFQDPDAYRDKDVERILEEQVHEDHEDHEHGPGCGHEAVEHGDHVDYLHDSHRHFLRGAKWFHHASQKD